MAIPHFAIKKLSICFLIKIIYFLMVSKCNNGKNSELNKHYFVKKRQNSAKKGDFGNLNVINRDFNTKTAPK